MDTSYFFFMNRVYNSSNFLTVLQKMTTLETLEDGVKPYSKRESTRPRPALPETMRVVLTLDLISWSVFALSLQNLKLTKELNWFLTCLEYMSLINSWGEVSSVYSAARSSESLSLEPLSSDSSLFFFSSGF